MTKAVVLQLAVEVEGKSWRLYTYDFQTPDGLFVGYLYAISAEHAVALIEDMKESAVYSGEIISGDA